EPPGKALKLVIKPSDIAARVFDACNRQLGQDRYGQPGGRRRWEMVSEHRRRARCLGDELVVPASVGALLRRKHQDAVSSSLENDLGQANGLASRRSPRAGEHDNL